MPANRLKFQYRDEKQFFWVAFVPTAVVVLLFIIFPIIFTLILSLFQKNLLSDAQTFIGLQNFVNLMRDPRFLRTFRNSLLYSVGSTFFATITGLLVALVLNEHFFGRSFLRAIVIFPYIVPPIVAIFVFRFLFNSRGIINHILMNIGVINTFIPWLGDSRYAMITSILISAWIWFPFATINCLAGLQTIPENLYEAAAIDGASAIKRFIYITLPVLMPVILVVIIIRFIWAVRNFEMIFLLTGGGPGDATSVLPILVFRAAFSTYRIGYASAVATSLFIFLAVFALIYFRIMKYSEIKN